MSCDPATLILTQWGRTDGVKLALQQRQAQAEVLHHEVLHGAAPVVHVLRHVGRLPAQHDDAQYAQARCKLEPCPVKFVGSPSASQQERRDSACDGAMALTTGWGIVSGNS